MRTGAQDGHFQRNSSPYQSVGLTNQGTAIYVYSPPYVDRIWLWAYYNKIAMFDLLKGDYTPGDEPAESRNTKPTVVVRTRLFKCSCSLRQPLSRFKKQSPLFRLPVLEP